MLGHRPVRSGHRVPFVEKSTRQDSIPAVWGSLLGMAILMAFNPALLALILLVISRPRPVQNLLVCWVGCLITNVPALLIPLMLLHGTPMFRSHAPAASSTARHVQLVMGVLVLSIAALITVRSWARRRAHVPAPGGNTSTLVLDSNTPSPISSPFGHAQDAATEGASAIRRLLGRLQNAWDSGSLWVALVVGMGFLPGPPLVLFVETTIVASGAAIGTQVIAVIVFVVAMFAVFEITLVSHLAAPAQTQAVLRPLHDWALANRRQVMIGIFVMIGFLQLVRGMGIA